MLAVAEPFLEQAGVKLGSGERTHKVLVLDGSYSMAFKPSDKSRFDRAKDLVAGWSTKATRATALRWC